MVVSESVGVNNALEVRVYRCNFSFYLIPKDNLNYLQFLNNHIEITMITVFPLLLLPVNSILIWKTLEVLVSFHMEI